MERPRSIRCGLFLWRRVGWPKISQGWVLRYVISNVSFIIVDETDVAKMFKRKLIEQVNADNGELKITPQTFADIPREEQRDSKSYPREGSKN